MRGVALEGLCEEGELQIGAPRVVQDDGDDGKVGHLVGDEKVPRGAEKDSENRGRRQAVDTGAAQG